MNDDLLNKMVSDPVPEIWLVAADYLEENGLDKQAARMRKRCVRVRELEAALYSVNLSQKLPVSTRPKLKEFGTGSFRVNGNESELRARFFNKDGYLRKYQLVTKAKVVISIPCKFNLDRSRMTIDRGYTLMMATFIVDKMYPIK